MYLLFVFGDPYGNRTHVTAVKGPCLNRLTNGPYTIDNEYIISDFFPFVKSFLQKTYN